MPRTRARGMLRAATVFGLLVVMGSVGPASAAKPGPTLKVSAAVSGFGAVISYQVNVPASQIAAQACSLDDGEVETVVSCDATPNQGSGAKLTKYSVSLNLPQAGAYTFEVDVTLANASHLVTSSAFAIVAGPAVRFSVTGITQQFALCYVTIDCAGWPPDDYPRQVATITALDANGNVATSYAGTVTFPYLASFGALADQTLTNGVAHVPVLFPALHLAPLSEPWLTHCPGGDVALTVQDTIDPSIVGCQSSIGGTLNFVLPDSFDDAPSDACPTGCLTEATGTITINTNTVPITIHQPVISPTNVVIAGGTAAGEYFTQSVTLGYFMIASGQAVDPFNNCTQCTSDLEYVAPDPILQVGEGISIDGVDFSVDGLVVDPFTGEIVEYEIQATAIAVEEPSCFADAGYTVLVDLCDGGIVFP